MPIHKLSKLRFLDVSFLGLDGSNPHGCGQEYGTPTALEALLNVLPDLRWLCHKSGNRTDQEIHEAFKNRAEQAHPKLWCCGGIRLQNQLKEICLSGKLRA